MGTLEFQTDQPSENYTISQDAITPLRLYLKNELKFCGIVELPKVRSDFNTPSVPQLTSMELHDRLIISFMKTE